MILDFNSFRINESSLKKLKKEIHGALERNDRKRMRHELKHNIITFKFRKRNGELRTAHGTLHPDYLPPLKGGGPRPELQMVYFDLDKDGWRSFRAYKFIKITDIKPVDGTVKPSKSSKPIKSEEEEEETKKLHTKPEEEKVEKEETKKVHSEKSEKEVHKEVEKDIEKEEHKEHHKEVEKEEPEKDSDDIKEPEDDEVFSKKKRSKISEHSEEDEHKEHHKHKTEDED